MSRAVDDVGGPRQLADRTPASRERSIDLLRAVAIIAVVLGHWLVAVVGYDNGRLTGHSALPELTWAQPITWLMQVMPVFFLAGGFANAASLTAWHRRGGTTAGWLIHRGGRLVRPTTALVVSLAAAALLARLLHADPIQVRLAVSAAAIPLWFLSVYLIVVGLAPVMYTLHRRYGIAVPVVLVGLVAAGDLARLHGREWLAGGGFLFGWLVIHQMGFFWRDGRLAGRRRLAATLLLGGLGVLSLLTVAGPYPVSMIDVPGGRIHNASPPSLALLALATAQLGAALLLRDPAERWLRRTRPWRAVVAVNGVVLTVFLWHMTAAVLLTLALHATGRLPTPAAGTAAWFAWRVPWLIMLTIVLLILVAIVAPIERRTPRPLQRPPSWPLALSGFAAVAAGLLDNSLYPRGQPALFGFPTRALIAYLIGAAILRRASLPWRR
ncbi:acyltransferase family protein [Dactylosporangium sp. CA-092794]|uniref:acyltransferase family protein n=1 Tax=Dactylosporangium sp. CA-092794 TaxID=3239929 RepID=UPI003D8A5A61